MKPITDLILRVADLVEAEGRSLREATIQVALGVTLIAVAGGSLLVGIVLVFWSFHMVVGESLGQAAAAAMTGALALAVGGLLAWLGRKLARP